jgi:hypothetical protein
LSAFRHWLTQIAKGDRQGTAADRMQNTAVRPAGLIARKITKEHGRPLRKLTCLVIGAAMPRFARPSARAARALHVLVLEGRPKFYRGGNTRHTRNMRCAHDAATDILTGPTPRGILGRSAARHRRQTDEELARIMIRSPRTS